MILRSHKILHFEVRFRPCGECLCLLELEFKQLRQTTFGSSLSASKEARTYDQSHCFGSHLIESADVTGHSSIAASTAHRKNQLGIILLAILFRRDCLFPWRGCQLIQTCHVEEARRCIHRDCITKLTRKHIYSLSVRLKAQSCHNGELFRNLEDRIWDDANRTFTQFILGERFSQFTQPETS